MSGRFPGAPTLRKFWQNLRNGVESLDTFTDAELDHSGVSPAVRAGPGWVARGTVLENAAYFDAGFFGYAPREAQIIDPQQRVFLECAWEALEDAGYSGEPDGRTVAIYAGESMNTYVFSQLLPNRDLLASVGAYQVMLGNDKDFLTTRVSYKLNLHGPSLLIQTACSTSLVAVQVACQSLLHGECDMAMAGGVSIGFPQRSGYQFQEGMIFSPDGTCRPFDAAAQGTRAGAGAGIVVLKRLRDALADRDTIHAVILAAAINNDGAGKAGYTAPSVEGQMEVIATAQALGGVSPESISYVEAHGTATPLGDPIEVAALTRVFREATDATGFCALGSLKANLGHLDAAAGVAGLIKTVLALRHRELPPQINFRAPNPQLQLPSSPFRVATSLEAWPSGPSPRRAAVSAFGIGGTNAHVVLEEAPSPVPSIVVRDQHLLVLSAKSAAALDAATANLAEYLGQPDAASLADVAYTLQVGRRPFAFRRSVVAREGESARLLLGTPERSPVATGTHEGEPTPVAFLFSGQGSQHARMCAELMQTERTFRAAVDRCAELLLPHLGRDIRPLLLQGTDEALRETDIAQPLLFVTSYALATLWISLGVRPSAMLGHSIGEYVAAHLSGVFSLEDALRLVATRGRLMQATAPGSMLAVRLPHAELRARLGTTVEIAAVNAPMLCTVSGTREGVAALVHELELAGVEHRPLHTSHAFHSHLMEPALAPFRDLLAGMTLSPPEGRFVSNVTGTWILPDEATSPDYWVSHLRSAVRFADGVATLASNPSMQLLEVGPGTALTTLARLTLGREGASRATASLPHPNDSRGDLESLLGAAGRLWVNGATIDWAGLHEGESLRRVPLPTYPFERQRHWVDAPAATTAVADSADSAASVERREAVDDWFYRPLWTGASLLPGRLAALQGTWLVFGRGDSLDAAVRGELEANGVQVVHVTPGATFAQNGDHCFQVRPTDANDHESLLRTLTSAGQVPRGVLHLWNAGEERDAESPGFALHSLTALSRALLLETPSVPIRLVVATSGAERLTDEPAPNPHRSLVHGPVLVLPTEHEALQASRIDLDDVASPDWVLMSSSAVVAEARADDADQCVAIRGGQRLVRRYGAVSLSSARPEALSLREGSVYLVTGGLGGIGVTFSEWLVRNVRCRVVLTARTALPPRAEWDDWIARHGEADGTSARIAAVRRLEVNGSEVMVSAVDVADREGMRIVLAQVQAQWGAIRGIFHAAGVPDGKLLSVTEPSDVEAGLRAKFAGTNVLAELLSEQPMDFVILCSSINAVFGAAGSSNYTAANAYLDAFAASSRKPDRWPAVSVNWDVWRDVGMATTEAKPTANRRAQVAAGIRPDQGMDALVRAVAAGLPHCVVSPHDVERVQQLRHRLRSSAAGSARIVDSGAASARSSGSAPKASVAPIPRQLSADHAVPAGEIESQLAAVWEDLLGVTPIGVHDNFFELGGHSLLATRVLARVDQSFGVRLPLRAIFEAPTIRQLRELIAAPRDAAVVAVLAGDREEFEL